MESANRHMGKNLSQIWVRVSEVILTEAISVRDTIKILAVLAEFRILHQIEYQKLDNKENQQNGNGYNQKDSLPPGVKLAKCDVRDEDQSG